ncbi:MAG: hypothetical protein C4582_00680 [Desulfobacteraceae bacterium]|nr:MAG: hypothetical protein C4582_00680 [Desulfobacteraceae bacterium]
MGSGSGPVVIGAGGIAKSKDPKTRQEFEGTVSGPSEKDPGSGSVEAVGAGDILCTPGPACSDAEMLTLCSVVPGAAGSTIGSRLPTD